ncbi:MAG: DUF4292 domain-containing protein [Marinilabiliaceae bacterium]|nr:DUF4292 domain-containing protein [Marinilabiliaceae bacterium]
MKIKYILIIIIAVLLLSSCKTKRKLSKETIPDKIAQEMLLENILNNQLDYKTLFVKRMNIELDDNGKSISARASMYIEKDKKIIIQINVLILEVARVLIENNEITVIDRINREVYSANFQLLKNKFNIDLNYTLLEKLLTNQLITYPDNIIFNNYELEEKSDKYLLKSFNETDYETMIKRFPQYYLHEMEVISETNKIAKHKMTNLQNIVFEVLYSSFENINGKKFPNTVTLRARKDREMYGLTLKSSGIEVNGSNVISFKVPDDYKKGVLRF